MAVNVLILVFYLMYLKKVLEMFYSGLQARITHDKHTVHCM